MMLRKSKYEEKKHITFRLSLQKILENILRENTFIETMQNMRKYGSLFRGLLDVPRSQPCSPLRSPKRAANSAASAAASRYFEEEAVALVLRDLCVWLRTRADELLRTVAQGILSLSLDTCMAGSARWSRNPREKNQSKSR